MTKITDSRLGAVLKYEGMKTKTSAFLMVEHELPTMTFCFAMDFHYTERIGGAEVQAWLLAKELARRGFEVHYLAQSLRSKAEVTESRDGVHLHWVRNPGYLQWRNGLRYYRALKRINPDLLIQRTTSFNTGVIGFYARKHRKQFAWICTDNDIPARWFFARKEIRTIPAKNLLGKLKSPLLLVNAIVHDLARDWGMKQASHIFTQNDEQFSRLFSNYKRSSLRMPSGHELPEVRISPQQRFHGKTILWVGNLGSNKRPEKYLQLARMMKRREWKFVMIGGREGANSFDEFFAKSRPENLLWLGELSFQDTAAWFDRAAILINTSESEGLPNTFIQAWLRGVPVVTLGVDPNQHIKKNDLGRTESNLQAMANALHELLADEARYCRMSERIAAFASRQFTITTVADHFLKAIHASKTAAQSRLADTHSQLACAS